MPWDVCCLQLSCASIREPFCCKAPPLAVANTKKGAAPRFSQGYCSIHPPALVTQMSVPSFYILFSLSHLFFLRTAAVNSSAYYLLWNLSPLASREQCVASVHARGGPMFSVSFILCVAVSYAWFRWCRSLAAYLGRSRWCTGARGGGRCTTAGTPSAAGVSSYGNLGRYSI